MAKGKILPTKARPNSQYFGVNENGTVKQLRIYGGTGRAIKDIDWGHPFQGHSKETVHRHIWNGRERLREHSPLTTSEVSKYRKAIETATGRKDLIWEW